MAYVAVDFVKETGFDVDAAGQIVRAQKATGPFYVRSQTKLEQRELLKVAA